MKRSNTLLMTIIYDGAEKFLDDYFNSVINQNTDCFDLLIINDNFTTEKLPALPVKILRIDIVGEKPASLIRYDGIRYGINHEYENLIFSDIDDYFSENRIGCSLQGLSDSDFVFNEIDIVSQSKDLISEKYLCKLINTDTIDSYNRIVEYNLFGLTHTAIKVKLFKKLYIPEDIIAVDWWIFTFLLLNGAKGKFINEATTFYRQTNNNTVGMNKKLTEQRLSFGISVKTRHYKNVLSYCINNKLDFATRDYSDKLEEMKELSEAIKGVKFKKLYIDAVNENFDQIYKGWWSEILPLKDWSKYAK